MDDTRECKTCKKHFNDFSSIKCQWCNEYLCNTCFRQGFFLRKSVFFVVAYRVAQGEEQIDMNRLQNDDFVFACSHLCQFRLARDMMTSM